MAEARDVDLAEWLNAAGFHPADNRLKQLGHEAARTLIGELGTALWQLLPPSREKSIIFTKLESVRHYANQALAVHGGPREHVTEENLQTLLSGLSVGLPQDPRIREYEAEQRAAGEKVETGRLTEHVNSQGERSYLRDAPAGPLADLPFPVPQAVQDQAGQGLPTPTERAERHPLI